MARWQINMMMMMCNAQTQQYYILARPPMPLVGLYIQGGPKSKPLPNYQKIVLHRIKACQWD